VKRYQKACVDCNKTRLVRADKNNKRCRSCCGKMNIVKNVNQEKTAESNRRRGREQNADKNPNWKGGYITKKGYRVLRKNGKYIFEHRYVMQEHVGRKLLPTENVHHINGNKADNRIENLELWTRAQPGGVRVSDLIRLYMPLIRIEMCI